MTAPRLQSETGYYHVVQKGAGGQILFESDRARQQYLLILQDALGKSRCTLAAWCLMGNHVHLLVNGEIADVSALIGATGQRYAAYFNYEEGHEGPVFQSPFYSEPVDTEEHLLAAVRYIHNNPQEAGICAAQDYLWSSYREYTYGAQIIDPAPVLELLGGIAGFERFSLWPDDFASSIPEANSVRARRLGDEEALAAARKISAPYAPSQLKTLPRHERNSHLAAMRDAGIGARQASRITGLGKSTISRAYRDTPDGPVPPPA